MRQVTLSVVATLGLMLVTAASANAQIDVELTFDDGPDGSGPTDGHAGVDNLETDASAFGEGAVQATLIGTSRRSTLSQGRYGRAAELLGGTGGIELKPWKSHPTRVFYMWLLPRDTSGGALLSQAESWDAHFEAGEIVVGAYRSTGEYVTVPTGAHWPDDGSFHHLTLQLNGSGTTPTVAVIIDLIASPAVDLGFVPQASTAPLQLGIGYDGFLDELLIKRQIAPSNGDIFDRNPASCPVGTTCIEEVITLVPRDFSHEVPVRFKTVYDEAACSKTSPCPVVFDVSGGNNCADDYDGPAAVSTLVKAGFVVVTVDLYCEGDDGTHIFPTETSQLIAVKDHVLSRGAARERISGSDYAATGCSHGAGTVAAWALREADHPARTFSRSTAGSGLCAYAAEKVCPQVLEAALAKLGLDSVDDLDPEDPLIRAAHEQTDFVGEITEELTRTREIARSWGVNLEGPICRDDGYFACNEQGQWGMTYASRRFRDVWERHQPSDRPSGYFVEDHSSDCQHCATPQSEAFRCGVCMLRVGRVAMEQECPECLSFDAQTIERGAPAELCPIDASWYTDPLADKPTAPGDDTPPGNGPPSDTGSETVATGDGNAGCGCVVGQGTRQVGAIPWIALAWLWCMRRRRGPRPFTRAREPAVGEAPDNRRLPEFL